MNDWFEWNGVRCTLFDIHVSEQPPITIPEQRVTQVVVPGRSGSLNVLEAEDVYDDMVLTATCWLSDPGRIPEIAAWLKGSGKITFANRPGGYYNAWVSNQIPFEKILRGNPHCSFVVNFRCSPFWHSEHEQSFSFTESGSKITNPGSVCAEPVITVVGEGDIELTINEQSVELSGLSDQLTIDSTLQEAYSDTTLANESMDGDFPVLDVGENVISWTGDVTSVTVAVRWRYL